MRATFALISTGVLIVVAACASSSSDPLGDWMDRKFGPPQVMPNADPPPAWLAAQRSFASALSRTVRPWPFYASQEPIQALRLRNDHFSFIDRGVVLKDVSTTDQPEQYALRRIFRYRDVPAQIKITGAYAVDPRRNVPLWGTPVPHVKAGPSGGYYEQFVFANQNDAEAFVRALYDLVRAAASDDSESAFESKAAAWRAVNPKPPLSEPANRERVLAEAAVRGRRFEEAIEHFEAALQTDPTWSSGNYNLALLYGETEDYAEAVRYMRRFLLLEPNSREAQPAREKMIVWEDKASRATR